MTDRSLLPLIGVRILDLTTGVAQACGRYLADLGADVVLVEPPGGSPERADVVGFALRNANKRGITLDVATAQGLNELHRLAGCVDIVLCGSSLSPHKLRVPGPEVLSAANPGLVVVSISDFGRTGPYADFVATEPVLAAMGGVLCRSGRRGEAPLLPPAGLIGQTVAVHAAWAALVALVKRMRTGSGEVVELSAFEAVVHGFDPGFGAQGSAAAGRPEGFPRGRPEAASFYPVFACADGHIRVCLLAKRQWRAMFAWLGEPAEFADPKYDSIPARFAASDRLLPLIAEHFQHSSRDDLVAEGTRRGIPIAAVLSVREVLAADHFTTTGALVEAEIVDGVHARVPSGYVSVGGRRAGLRSGPPQVGAHNRMPLPAATEDPSAKLELSADVRGGPLSGLRVLDLGVIVFGAELGRLFADQGADVIKVEAAEFPDGLRQTRKGGGMNASFAWGNRNKRGLGLDLRSADGAALFRRLVAHADIVAANFKPGTLESLGLAYSDLKLINPRIIVSESSAFGSRGPWSARMGYGPLVRAACGVTASWAAPVADVIDEAELFCDGTTVYPDHIAAHVAAVAVLAAVIGRARSGRGTAVELSQSDVAIMQLGPTLAAESLAPGSFVPPGNAVPGHAPAGVFPCSGDDEWCVIDVRTDDEWRRLAAAIGGHPHLAESDLATSAGRLKRRDHVEAIVAAWTAQHSPAAVMNTLQAAAVPAALMLRLPAELADPHLTHRHSFAALQHPLLSAPVPANARVARFSTISDPPQRPAPVMGEHTTEIVRELLGLDPEVVTSLIGRGVLQPPLEESAASEQLTPIAAPAR